MKKLFKNEKRVFYEADTEVAEALSRMAELAREKTKLTKERAKIVSELEALLIEEHGDDPVYIAVPGYEARWYKGTYLSAAWLKEHYPKIYREALRDTRGYLVVSKKKK